MAAKRRNAESRRSPLTVRERAAVHYAAQGHTPIVLFDTNIVLDVLLKREPWGVDGARLLALAASNGITGVIASHAITTIHDIVARSRGNAAALAGVSDLLGFLTVVELSGHDFQRALSLGLGDFEDAVQVAACLRIGADYLASRNATDFKGAPVLARSAGELLALFGA